MPKFPRIYCRVCGKGIEDNGVSPQRHLNNHGLYEGSHYALNGGYHFHFANYVTSDIRRARREWGS